MLHERKRNVGALQTFQHGSEGMMHRHRDDWLFLPLHDGAYAAFTFFTLLVITDLFLEIQRRSSLTDASRSQVVICIATLRDVGTNFCAKTPQTQNSPLPVQFQSLDHIINQILKYAVGSVRWRTRHRGELDEDITSTLQRDGRSLVHGTPPAFQPYERSIGDSYIADKFHQDCHSPPSH